MAKESLFKKNIWKWLVLAIITVGSLYLVCPPKDKIRLGLDLAGGTRFTLEVDQDKLKSKLIEQDSSLSTNEVALSQKMAEVLEGSEERIVSIIRRRVDAMGTNEPNIVPVKGENRFIVELPGAGKDTTDKASARLKDMAYLEFCLVAEKEQELINAIKGAPEGYVAVDGGFVRANNYNEVSTNVVNNLTHVDRLASFGLSGKNRRDLKFAFERATDEKGVQKKVNYEGKMCNLYKPRYIERKVQLTGDGIASASAAKSQGFGGGWEIAFSLKKDKVDGGKSASQIFAEVTRRNIGRPLAIILDNELISSPNIQSAIEGGSGQITGNFTQEEAKALANDLNAGALPAPLKIAAQSTVAPSVGADAINSGIYAGVIGFMLVALFMIFYYWQAGFVANIALLLDVILLPASLFLVANILGIFVDSAEASGGVQLPVLTMPGIAGLVLTLGMAVDANVLIYERVREEFERGATAGKAIAAGYGKAFTAIVDSNITTILTGVILYVVGTGPVRGFAIMLTGGVVISMFTAIVVTRLVFDHTVDPNRTKPFKMLQFFKNPNIDFMKMGKKCCIASLLIIVVTLSLFAYRVITNPRSVLAVDLTGGTTIVYAVKSESAVDVGAVRKAIEPFDNAAQIQTGTEADGTKTLTIKTGVESDDTKGSVDALLTGVDGLTLEDKSCEVVGSSVGADLRKSGTQAVIFSLIGILIYIGFRFRMGFGFGGILALAHDALISFGLFSLCGRQVSLIVITALLTIIGYSINDTVVVFDRIREMLKRDSRTPFNEICNKAINSCLSRTTITSLTTFFTVAVLFIFVDGSIFDFALTMLFGIVAGTYSSIFIATPAMCWWYRKKRPSFDDGEGETAKAK